MSFIDDTVVAAKEWFDVASKKTSEAVGIQKLRIAIAKKRSELSKEYETLGRAYFESVNNSDMDEVLAQMVETIELTKQDLADLKAQLDAAKKLKVCSVCWQKNPAGAAFCNGCGAALPTAAPQAEPADQEAEPAAETEE